MWWGGGRGDGGGGSGGWYTLLYMKRLNKTESLIFVLLVFYVSKGTLLDLDFSFTVQFHTVVQSISCYGIGTLSPHKSLTLSTFGKKISRRHFEIFFLFLFFFSGKKA